MYAQTSNILLCERRFLWSSLGKASFMSLGRTTCFPEDMTILGEPFWFVRPPQTNTRLPVLSRVVAAEVPAINPSRTHMPRNFDALAMKSALGKAKGTLFGGSITVSRSWPGGNARALWKVESERSDYRRAAHFLRVVGLLCKVCYGANCLQAVEVAHTLFFEASYLVQTQRGILKGAQNHPAKDSRVLFCFSCLWVPFEGLQKDTNNLRL